MTEAPRGRGARVAETASGLVPRGLLRWAVARGAPAVRMSGWTSIGSVALAKALTTLAQPPRHLFSRSGTLTVEQVADRLGRDVEQVRRWQRQGLLESDDADVVDRRTFDRALLIDLALNEGAAEDQLVRSSRDGGLVWAALDSVLTSGGGMTGADAARAADIAPELYEAVWKALGLPVGDLELAAFDRRDVNALRTLRALGAVFPDEDMIEASSVVGRAMAEVSKVVVDVFRRRLAEPLLDSGGTETDVVVRLAAMRDLLVPALAPLLEVALRRHLAAAIRSEISVAAEQLLAPGEGSRVVAVGFADLVGFTEVSDRLPAEEVGHLAATLLRAAESAVSAQAGRVIKGIGDAVMFTVPDPVRAAAAGVEMVERIAETRGMPPVRVGIGYGAVLPAYADYFGRTVNLASRLCAAAGPGEVLLHVDGEGVPELAWAEAGLTTTARDVGALKGISSQLRVATVSRPAPPR